MKIAVQCHIYDSNIFWDDIEPRLKNIGQEFDLYISLTDNVDRTRDINRLKTKYPNCYVGSVPNVGEDLRGFFHCLNHIFDIKKEYDVVLKLHTKTNPQPRKIFLDCVLNPNQTHIRSCINNPLFGMYGPKSHRFTLTRNGSSIQLTGLSFNAVYWDNKPRMAEMCKRIKCKTLCFDFFGGTMFWINFGLLKKYFGNNQIPEDYFCEPYATNGLRAHAGERIFGCICHNEHLKICDETINPFINIVIVHYNTPELTTALIKSINKFSPNSHIHIFDNSDSKPFPKNLQPNITIYDNTESQIIDFDDVLKNSYKCNTCAGKSNWGSVKHSLSIDKCIELIGEDFILLDSDVLLKQDISQISNNNYICSAEVIELKPTWKKRILPFICYINYEEFIKNNIKFFTLDMVGMKDDIFPLADTGSNVYEKSKENMLVIQSNKYIVHLASGSWDKNNQDEFLLKNKHLYE